MIFGVNFLRFDMSEYIENNYVVRFIGVPLSCIIFEQGIF
ncbi:hypothetical protein DSUL_150008 [Desulfovibrionales bacterium]